MTQQDLDSFIRKLIDLDGKTPYWYWDMLNLAKGKLTAERVNFVQSMSKNSSKADQEMVQQLIYFYNNRSEKNIKIYLNTVRLFMPIVARHDQVSAHLEFSEIKYYKHIIEFVSFIQDSKLQYDVLTCVINKLQRKLDLSEYKKDDDINLTYYDARSLRSRCDYAKNTNDAKVLETRMQDLHHYIEASNQVQNKDANALKLDIAKEMACVGWKQFGKIAEIPHAHFGPNNMLSKDIAAIGDVVRNYIADAGYGPEIQDLLNKIIWPKFETENVREQILTGKFNPNEIPMLVANLRLQRR